MATIQTSVGGRGSEYKAAIVELPRRLKELQPKHREEHHDVWLTLTSPALTSSCKTGTDATIKTLPSQLVLLQICTTIWSI